MQPAEKQLPKTHIYWVYTFLRLGGIVAIKIRLLLLISPLSGPATLGNSLSSTVSSTYWIYNKSVQEFIMQDAYYLDLQKGQDAEKVFQDLQQQGIIDEYDQPFIGVDIPHYRVHFVTREDVTKRTIALLMSKGVFSQVEGIPRFEIQQTGVGLQDYLTTGIGPTVSVGSRQKKFTRKLVRFSTQAVRDENFERQWYMDDIGMQKDALACLTGSAKKIKVAIIDNAFLSHHASFSSGIKMSIDVADGDTDVMPPSSDAEWMHGTHGAGLIAGKKLGNKGIIGTSLGSADLYLIKATENAAEPTEITHGIEAFAKAVELNVDIISLSRGAYIDFPMFRKVIAKAHEKGITVIAAAGNYGSPDLFYPAAYPDVISVGAFGKSGAVSEFSNYGPWVDIYAPGEELVVPDIFNGFAKTDGTSAAAPLFAGMYALLLRHFGPGSDFSSFYTTQVNKKPYVNVRALCSSYAPTKPLPISTGTIQTIQPKEKEPAQDIVHQAPPEQEDEQEVPLPELSRKDHIWSFVTRWGGWVVAGILLVVVSRLGPKIRKKPSSPVTSG